MSLSDLMKQAQEMQSKMQGMQEELENLKVVGESGAGLVKVTMNGKHNVESIFIDPTLLKVEADDDSEGAGNKEILEDLIAAATNNAVRKVEDSNKAKMSEMTGGLSLPPGFKLPF